MSTAIASEPSFIERDAVYALEEFRRRVGWGRDLMRKARRSGLHVVRVGTRAYVRGRDFLDWLDSQEMS